jgi:hypothetical protein
MRKDIKPLQMLRNRVRRPLLAIKTKSVEDKKTANHLLSTMKSMMTPNTTVTRKASSVQANYIFVEEKLRGGKEDSINSFLNSEGVFKIYLSIALEQF